MRAPDFITVLRARGRRLAKLVRADGSVESYDDAKTFDMAAVKVADLDHLHRHIERIIHRPDLCIVRGTILDPTQTKRIRRLIREDCQTGDKPTIGAADHRWIALDVDGIVRPDDVPAQDLLRCAHHIIELLPGEFRSARCIVVATASHGIKPGCRLRLWFWAERPLSGAELAYWMRRSPVDRSLFFDAQVAYTAAPIFAGCSDHLPFRIALRDGTETVETPPPGALTPRPPPRPSAPRLRTLPDQHASRLMVRALSSLTVANEGQRHGRLRAASYTFGGLMDAHGISEAEATRALMDAVLRAGGSAVDQNNAAATIASGLIKGQAKPLITGSKDHG